MVLAIDQLLGQWRGIIWPIRKQKVYSTNITRMPSAAALSFFDEFVCSLVFYVVTNWNVNRTVISFSHSNATSLPKQTEMIILLSVQAA